MGTGDFNAGGNPAIDQRSIQGEQRYSQSLPAKETADKLRPLRSNAHFTLLRKLASYRQVIHVNVLESKYEATWFPGPYLSSSLDSRGRKRQDPGKEVEHTVDKFSSPCPFSHTHTKNKVKFHSKIHPPKLAAFYISVLVKNPDIWGKRVLRKRSFKRMLHDHLRAAFENCRV